MNTNLDSCLKLILPRALEPQFIDHLLQHPEWVGPFSTHLVEGHGDPESIASIAEQVRGRAELVQVEILLESQHAQQLIEHLRRELPSKEIVWWLSPVLAMGSFA